ncbi:MAG: aldo/keto reductase [Armatimonadota bacterium]|nr:aldo/keto reductase [Armatimonadota bacterium]
MERRPFGNTGVSLSIIGFGGIVVSKTEQSEANRLVGEAFYRGINYFDVAPTYGNAQERLGPALQPYRQEVFLACKTTRRDAAGARAELEESLRLLRTDHFDLYQLHGVAKMEDVEQILAPGGALEAFVAARDQGLVRYLGFSCHLMEAALALMDAFPFTSILFPVNFVAWYQGNFGPQAMEKAKEKDVARLALKAMARTSWPAGAPRTYPKCWYQPIDDPELASLALRWTLSQPITAAIPPGEVPLFRLAMDVADRFRPLTADEYSRLQEVAASLEPIFRMAA